MHADMSKDVTLKSDDMSEKSIAAGKIDTVIFDLDGTLLYTIEDLAASTNHALQQYGMPERTLEEVTAFVGNGVAKLIERAVVPGMEKELFDKVFAEFKSIMQSIILTTQDHIRELLICSPDLRSMDIWSQLCRTSFRVRHRACASISSVSWFHLRSAIILAWQRSQRQIW